MPYAKSILGVDVSQGMVNLYNETGEKEGFSGMKAVHADLKGEDGELDGRKFDVIIVSIAPSGRGGTQLKLSPAVNSAIWHITISKTSGR
jgi:predicted methyltransferase